MKLLSSLVWTPFGYALGSIGIIFIIPTCFLVILPLKQRLNILIYLWQAFAIWVCTFCFACRFQFFDRRNKEDQRRLAPGLYIGNHQSYTDIPVNLMTFQVPSIMKKQVLRIPLIGLLGLMAGAVSVDRQKKESRKKAFDAVMDRVKTGLPIQFYPEGTRNPDIKNGPLNYEKIKKTLLLSAFDHNIPVTAVSLYNTEKIIGPFGLIHPFITVGQIIHPVLYPSDYECAEDFAKACWQKVIDGYLELKQSIE